LAIERGSEANAPLARAILGGLLAGEPATLFVLPALYSLLVRDKKRGHDDRDHAHPETPIEPPPSEVANHALDQGTLDHDADASIAENETTDDNTNPENGA
jgi:hypothetical protein